MSGERRIISGDLSQNKKLRGKPFIEALSRDMNNEAKGNYEPKKSGHAKRAKK